MLPAVMALCLMIFFEMCLEYMPAPCVKKSVAFLLFGLCRIVVFLYDDEAVGNAIKKGVPFGTPL